MEQLDFVVAGATLSNGVILLASKTLSEVVLREEMNNIDIFAKEDMFTRANPTYSIEMSMALKDYVTIFAPTYPEAWNNLFAYWTEEDTRQGNTRTIGMAMEIEPKQKEITA